MASVQERAGLDSAPPQSPSRFSCFDGLRAMAATAVVVHHVGFQTGASYRYQTLGAYLARMDSGVSVFFLISGFLLYRPFVVANLTGRPRPAIGGFYRRRIFRIFPAYWVTLTFAALFLGLHLRGVRGALAFFSLTQIYSTHLYRLGISQAWSLATEISFYLVLPAYAWLLGRLCSRRAPAERWRVELAGLAVLGIGGAAFRTYVDLASPSWHLIGIYWLPAYLDLFAIGMVLALAHVAMAGSSGRRRITDAVGRHPGLSWTAAAATLWLVATHAGLPRGLEIISGPRELLKHGLYGVMALFLVLPAVFGPETAGRVRGWLRWRPVVYVGLVSYGIYIWHEALLGQIRAWTGTRLFQGNFYAYLLATLAFSLAVASLSWFVLERPLVRWAKRP